MNCCSGTFYASCLVQITRDNSHHHQNAQSNPPPSVHPEQPNTPSVLDIVAALALGTQNGAGNQGATSTENAGSSAGVVAPPPAQSPPNGVSDAHSAPVDLDTNAGPHASENSD
ncbi:hypothetical protein PINS_up008832 [Pythium insidiosum]|nr:hypothetical protein PINS_up008832 [Pythium insidiosum]